MACLSATWVVDLKKTEEYPIYKAIKDGLCQKSESRFKIWSKSKSALNRSVQAER